MLPIKKIYLDTRHKTYDSIKNTDFKIDLPVNISLPSNTAMYLTDICIPVSSFMIEEERNNNIFVTKGDYKYCFRTIPTGNYDTISLNQAIVDVMNTAYAKVKNAYPVKIIAQPDIINNIVIIRNNDDQFQILTEEQATYAINHHLQLFDTYPTTNPTLPLKSINNMLQNFSANTYYQDAMFVFRLC